MSDFQKRDISSSLQNHTFTTKKGRMCLDKRLARCKEKMTCGTKKV